MTTLIISPEDSAIHEYYQRLKEAKQTQNASHEGNVRRAFGNLLEATAKPKDLRLITEQSVRQSGKLVRFDGVLRDKYNLPHGHWEAKDTSDNLENAVTKKRSDGYPLKNIIFENTQEAILYQGGHRVSTFALSDPAQVADLLTRFYEYRVKPFEDFEEAVTHFQTEIPHIAKDLNEKIKAAHQDNAAFKKAYNGFMELCRKSVNPNISRDAVDEMLIQHLLTERLMRTVFDMVEFTSRNVIASEIEVVINALTSKHFNRKEFLGHLDRFYQAIERAADELATFAEKQDFINTVYERFFQGYSVKIADTHGIVYTPQPIVDFMVASVAEVLETEFNQRLGSKDVAILDPCTGTGNFMVNVLRYIAEHDRRNLESAYANRLYANEVMLLPYYVASLNIEHAYRELTGNYEPFEGLCFVDTLDLAEGRQQTFDFMTERNAERVERQKKAPITVIMGNPPYNVGQLNENDNNKNRVYATIDQRIRETYVADSKATNRNMLYDAYVRFFRWASDRLGERDGVVCYVTNNSFVDGFAFDGMRKVILEDFTRVYHLDLHGNVRQNPKISGTSHNVFGIQVGVGITVAIKSSKHNKSELLYHRVPELWRREEKLNWLESVTGVGAFRTPPPTPPLAKGGELDRTRPAADNLTKGREQALGGLDSEWQANANAHERQDSLAMASNHDGQDYPRPMDGEGSDEKKRGWAGVQPKGKLWEQLRTGAREMRNNPTEAEEHLWQHIRKRKIAGFKFRRQHSIQRFIVDFYCAEAQLVIEVDGEIHDSQREYDAVRQEILEDLGMRVLRFRNEDVLEHTARVLDEIEGVLLTPPLAPPRTQGGGLESGELAGIGDNSLAGNLAGRDNFERQVAPLPLLGEGLGVGFNMDNNLHWENLRPDNRNSWLVPENAAEFAGFISIGNKKAKRAKTRETETIFSTYSGGVKTNRDVVVYDFSREALETRIHQFIEDYNMEVLRYQAAGQPDNVDDFVNYDKIKWSHGLKSRLERGNLAEFHEIKLRTTLYRPFSKRHLFFDEILNEAPYLFPYIFPNNKAETENRVILVPGIGNRKDFGVMISDKIGGLDFAFEKVQCFPFYTYDEDGSNRRENITNWALEQFQTHYGDKTITKWDIFYYVYGLLHHPDYRERYADSLKRELPRIPYASDFWAFAEAGKQLAHWHLDYEDVEPYELDWKTTAQDGVIDFTVKKMALRGKEKEIRGEGDSQQTINVYDHLKVNETLTLAGIPREVFDYRLGNRSALEWVVDQYRVKKDKRSGITHDPNAFSDDPKYIVDLVEKVVRVSLETVKIVEGLAGMDYR